MVQPEDLDAGLKIPADKDGVGRYLITVKGDDAEKWQGIFSGFAQ